MNETDRSLFQPGKGNLNPADIGFVRLIAEDFRTHGKDPLSQGFWAIAVHRTANWGRGRRFKVSRLLMKIIHRILSRFVEWTCGITIMDSTRMGRRVRIWHHSGIVINAASIGNDVVIRQNTTLGNAKSGSTELPIIEDGVEIGCGVAVLGPVRVGRGSMIGANAVVIRDVPPDSVAVGVPAKTLPAGCAE